MTCVGKLSWLYCSMKNHIFTFPLRKAKLTRDFSKNWRTESSCVNRQWEKNARNLSCAISHYIGLANSCFPVISAFLSFRLSGHFSSLIFPTFRSFQLSDPSGFPFISAVWSFRLSGHFSFLIFPAFRSFQLSDPSGFPVISAFFSNRLSSRYSSLFVRLFGCSSHYGHQGSF